MMTAGSAGLGAVGLASGVLPDGIGPPPEATLSLALILTAAAIWAFLSDGHHARWAIASWWLLAGLAAAAHAAPGKPALPLWVPPAEYALIGVAFASGGNADGLIRRVLTAAAAVALALFGAVHVFYRAAIAGLIPGWIPGAAWVPILTGVVMLIAAVALTTRWRPPAALLVAAMFASWLPLVHAGRLWNAPADPGEWIFALLALCLSGAMVTVARRGGTK